MRVLALDVSGMPRRWISIEQSIFYHAKDLVAWYLGENLATYHGGIQRTTGEQSRIATPSIIAIKGKPKAHFNPHDSRVTLSNETLFQRDRRICAYCGDDLATRECTKDHIIPKSKGGSDSWMNIVTACKSCNHKKGDKTLKEVGMSLLYVPYIPNHYEHLILQNRNILADQMEYLRSGVPKESRILI